MEVTTTWYLVLAAVLFTIGAVGVLIRRNPLVLFMCVELMLNAVTLTFVAFNSALGGLGGQMAVFFCTCRSRCRGSNRISDHRRYSSQTTNYCY